MSSVLQLSTNPSAGFDDSRKECWRSLLKCFLFLNKYIMKSTKKILTTCCQQRDQNQLQNDRNLQLSIHIHKQLRFTLDELQKQIAVKGFAVNEDFVLMCFSSTIETELAHSCVQGPILGLLEVLFTPRNLSTKLVVTCTNMLSFILCNNLTNRNYEITNIIYE